MANAFKPIEIDFSTSIAANEYQKGGIINTLDLTELPKDFANAFVLDPVEHTKQITNVLVIYNPVSGGGKAKQLVKEYIIPKLESCKIKAYVLLSEGPKFITKYLIERKEKILELKIDTFIIVGGDGTYHEFVNGYIGGNYIAQNIPVLFACGGTGNSLCLNCGINDEMTLKKILDKFCKYVQINKPINIQYMDCIEINSLTDKKQFINDTNESDIKDEHKQEFKQENDINTDNKGHITYVCSQTYWGIPAASATTAESLRFFGGYRYDIAALYQIVRKDPRQIKLAFYFDDSDTNIMSVDIDVSVLVAMKNKYFGKGLMITPLAKMDNGMLDVAILPNASRRHILGLFSLVPNGTHILNTSKENGPFYFRCKKLVIEPYDGCHAELGVDGEKGPHTPFEVNVLPKSVPMIM